MVNEKLDLSKYSFNKQCISFLQQIEKDYGKSIILIKKDLGQGEHGFARVENNQPIIEMNNDEEKPEELIIHEAYHLRLKYDGMPNIGFNLSQDFRGSNKIYLQWFTHLFWDKITHHYFYKHIKEDLKINPYESFKKELQDTYRKGEIGNLNDATKQISLAGLLLQTWIETQDKVEIDQFKEFLENQYNGQGVEMGLNMIKLLEQTRLETFDNCVSLFCTLFNYVHSDQRIRIINKILESDNQTNFIQQKAIFIIGSI